MSEVTLSKEGRHSCLTRWVWVCSVWLLFAYAAAGETKWLRLRNQLVATPDNPPITAAPTAYSGSPSAQLFIIQFQGPIEAKTRESLTAFGVELLAYLPDDAFVVRAKADQAYALRALSGVHYVGLYHPEYKLPNRMAKASLLGETPQAIRILTPASLTAAEISQLPLTSLTSTARYQYGLVLDATATAAQVAALAQSASVLWLEPATAPRLCDESAIKIVGGTNANGGAPVALHAAGYDGSGVVVAVADSGLSGGQTGAVHPDLAGRIDAFIPYGGLASAADELGHGTHISGIIGGNGKTGEKDENGALYGLGMAPAAHLVVQRIFDADGRLVPNLSNAQLAREAVRAGAVIGCNSWGVDTNAGVYDLRAYEFDSLVRDADSETDGMQPYLLVFAAGNVGVAQSINSPAVAKNVIAVGASQNVRTNFSIFNGGPDALADFSSRGPAADGRIKPDLVAPGTWIASARVPSVAASEKTISDNYQYDSGTSQAGAALSGAAAVFVQYYRSHNDDATPSPALVKAALINLATDLGGTSGLPTAPDNQQGWGRVNLLPLVADHWKARWIDQTERLATGQTYEKRIRVSGTNAPLRITLAYTDVPGTPLAIPALVNDLDLEVVDPNGNLYLGNQFENGDSVANSSTRDNLNNVEAVRLASPIAGEYVVRVRARNVPMDAVSTTSAVDQDFALAITGPLVDHDYGIIAMNANVYTAPSVIQFTLWEDDLPEPSLVKVLVSSSSQPNPVLVPLKPAGEEGVYTGKVEIARMPLASDGRLYVAHGDVIRAQYEDVDPPGVHLAYALADLIPPIASQISITNLQGAMLVSWLTDELASGTVYYGTNQAVFSSVAETGYGLTHQCVFPKLVAGATYYFWLVSTDQAGNSCTNNNGGSYYSFVAPSQASVLLVNAYQSDGWTDDLPLSGYTNALTAAQVNYQVWDVTAEGRSPTLDELKRYSAVIWRLNDSFAAIANTLSPEDQTALRQYLAAGGSLFMASMELLDRLGANNTFVTDSLHVQSFSGDNQEGSYLVNGLSGDAIGDALQLNLDFSIFPKPEYLQNADLSNPMAAAADATGFLLKGDYSTVGIHYPASGQDGTGRVVFLSIPLEAVSESQAGINYRALLLRRIVAFLVPDSDGAQSIALNSPVYSLPAYMTIEVVDYSRSSAGQIVVEAYSDLDTNGLAVTLAETTQPSVFRGFVALVRDEGSPVSGKLRGQHQGEMWVEYTPENGGNHLRVTAKIDTEAPVISGVSAGSSYQSANVNWTTTKVTDGLVQFGETALLGRTAYVSLKSTDHSVALNGLVPDRSYYYQVVSRDAAGNQTIDNNSGSFYSFRTAAASPIPWQDDLEAGAANWNEFEPGAWELGTPQNGRQNGAHSGVNAWGSSLKESFIGSADYRLVSPALYLEGGNTITLNFWQDYAFKPVSEWTDFYHELGQLQISTNVGVSWQPLLNVTGTSSGWEQQSVDLSEYAGQVVWLSWYYVLYDAESMARSGWLIDDVSITVTNIFYGNIAVTNNLSQAKYTITGPVNLSGEGWHTSFTRVPYGEYVVNFLPVPYYTTPAPQTNQLAGGLSPLFSGLYTFQDANQNGIPDTWEMDYFGELSVAGQLTTDHDGDGASDYAEFIAGTNPTNTMSKLSLTMTNVLDGTLQLVWPAELGRSYRVWSSTNYSQWSLATSWIRATNSPLTLTVTPAKVTKSYRVEVTP